MNSIQNTDGWGPIVAGALTVPETGRYRITLQANVILFPFIATSNYVIVTLLVSGTSVSSSQAFITNFDTSFSIQGEVYQTVHLDLIQGQTLSLSAVRSVSSATAAITNGFTGFDGLPSPSASLAIMRIS